MIKLITSIDLLKYNTSINIPLGRFLACTQAIRTPKKSDSRRQINLQPDRNIFACATQESREMALEPSNEGIHASETRENASETRENALTGGVNKTGKGDTGSWAGIIERLIGISERVGRKGYDSEA